MSDVCFIAVLIKQPRSVYSLCGYNWSSVRQFHIKFCSAYQSIHECNVGKCRFWMATSILVRTNLLSI